jgi:poly(A) polymerase
MSKKIEKQKMATITEVYNRIVWDAQLNRNMFIAGFHERISDAIREKPLAQWHDNSDIPWHRVRYIRCAETIVWDRDQRIDLISTNQLPAIAWKSDQPGADQADLAALVTNNRVQFVPRSIYHCDRDTWKIYTGVIKSVDLDRSLKIVSYNILSDLYEVDKIYTEQRLPLILNELAQTNADIIALQEVTPTSLAFILATDWVKDYFISESPSGNDVKPYGNLLLSRWHFDLVEHQFTAHKRVLVGTWNLNNRSLHVANIHLTSDHGENSLQKRTQQLATVTGHLQQQTGDCAIVGDFNTRGNEQDEILAHGNFGDLWPQLQLDQPGYTFDPTTNPLAKLMSLTGEPGRIDRMLWCPGKDTDYQPQSIELFAAQPVVEDGVKLYPSDHFGLCSTFSLSRSQAPVYRSIITLDQNIDLTTIEPVYESILAIIPPADLLPSIQAIRQQYDNGFIRILPHITLLYGFLPDRYFEKAVDIIAPILANMQPFTITLADFQIFTHHKSSTAWLRPVVKPEGALHELQKTLYELFPQCYEQSTKTAAGFNPHLSVGQFANPAEAYKILPQWHPLKFTVNSVALLSRRREESCVIRQKIGIGKVLPKIANSYELEDLIFAIEPELTEADRTQRKTIIELVKQACTESLGSPAAVYLLGSARLEVETATSDLDVVCVIPDYVTGENFLNRVAASLAGLCNQADVILTAKFPLLRLQIEGISLDLLYTPVTTMDGWEHLSIPELQTQIKEPKSIVGCWEAELIIDTVGQQLPLSCYRLLLRAVRAWAKSRGIYGNSWGFLGGFSWSVLCAYTCLNYHDRDRSLEALLTHFFKMMSGHNYRKVIALTEIGKQYVVKLPQDIFPIVSSIEPCKNTARNITKSTANILQEEFIRGAKITKQILHSKDSWANLYQKADPSTGANLLLTISVSDTDPDRCQQASNAVGANIIGLIIELEQSGLFIRPDPCIEHDESMQSFKLYLILSDNFAGQSIEQIGLNFIDRFNGVIDTSKISLSLNKL